MWIEALWDTAHLLQALAHLSPMLAKCWMGLLLQEVVSRTFYQSFVVRPDNIYVIRGSSTTQQWQDVRAAAQQAVQSFRMPDTLQ